MEYLTGSKQVTLVDANDLVLGTEDVFVAHQYPPRRHRASSVWLFRPGLTHRVEVLLQKRSQFKPLGAGWWGNAICGNVKPDETYLACAHRRLKEEINLENVNLLEAYKFEYQAYGNEKYGEHEIDQVFIGLDDSTPNPNLSEASEVGWVDWLDLLAQVRQSSRNTLLADPARTFEFEAAQLSELTPTLELTMYLINQDAKRTLLLAPWTAMMILDVRLTTCLHDFFPF